MKTSEVLRGAGDVLRTGGWKRNGFGNLHSSTGPHCVLGSIAVAGHVSPNTDNPDYEEPRSFLTLVIQDTTPANWNDNIASGGAEVMHVLDAAYVLALQEEGTEPEDVL